MDRSTLKKMPLKEPLLDRKETVEIRTLKDSKEERPQDGEDKRTAFPLVSFPNYYTV